MAASFEYRIDLLVVTQLLLPSLSESSISFSTTFKLSALCYTKSMIEHTDVVVVDSMSAKDVYGFMLNCTDELYNQWWPGTHLAFHTIERKPNDLRNLVYFDEMVGKRRLRYHTIVTKANQNREIEWQLKKPVLLPVRFNLQVQDIDSGGVQITSQLTIGSDSIGGRLIAFGARFYMTSKFKADLSQHAHTEFQMLAELLRSKSEA